MTKIEWTETKTEVVMFDENEKIALLGLGFDDGAALPVSSEEDDNGRQ